MTDKAIKALISIEVEYDPKTVALKGLQSDLEKNVREFVGMGGLQNSNEDAEVLRWESTVKLTPESGPVLPDGWEAESVDSYPGITVLHAPSKSGMVTVDYSQRVFRGGLSTSGLPTSTRTYKGRGWKVTLEQDAVAWLSAVLSGQVVIAS